MSEQNITAVSSAVFESVAAKPQRKANPYSEKSDVQVSHAAGQTISVIQDFKVEVSASVARVNQALREMDRDFSLRMDGTLNRPIVSLVKESTGEVVQQLPTKEFLAAAKNIKHLTGILLKLKG